MSAPPANDSPVKVDRQHTTPFLLKLFYRQGGFHRLVDDFRAHQQPRDYIQIYTWRDCTLHELSILLSDALPSVCPPRSRCGFRLIYADTRYGTARYTSKDLGAVVPSGDSSLDTVAKKTLGEVQFVVGDWIDVAIYPEGHGGVSIPRAYSSGRGAMVGPPRENGYGGFKPRGSGVRGGFGDRIGAGVPSGEWRRGEKVEDYDGGSGYGRGGGGGFRRGGRRFRD